jgi:hypothetical protein
MSLDGVHRLNPSYDLAEMHERHDALMRALGPPPPPPKPKAKRQRKPRLDRLIAQAEKATGQDCRLHHHAGRHDAALWRARADRSKESLAR